MSKIKEKFFNFLNIKVQDNDFKNMPINKKMIGIILEIKENELIIASNTKSDFKFRVIITQNKLIPNMVYPNLLNKNKEKIELKDFSLRDKIEIEYDNLIENDIIIPINSLNTILNIINLDIQGVKND